MGVACLAMYTTVAVLLDFVYLVFPGDANARMANGFYVLYANDPHLGAIGFIWNPLQSVLDMVPLLFKDLWPALSANDLAASIVSLACMTGAVLQLRAGLAEWGVRRIPRLIMVAAFALNPMVLFYAGNGMSEGLYLFTLVATCRYLARWLIHDDAKSLAYAGAALGLCYLTRIEAVGPAVFAGLAVTAISYRRARGTSRERGLSGLLDATIFLSPFAVSFAGWAVAGYAITGQAFGQLSSTYGTAQISVAGYHHTAFTAGIAFEGRVLEYLAPLLPVILVAAVVAGRRRHGLALVVAAVCGGALVFDVVAYLNGGIINSYRYFIAAVPLEVLLAGCLLANPPPRVARPALEADPFSVQVPADVRLHRPQAAPGRPAAVLGVLVAVVALGLSIPTTAAGMFNPKIGSEESNWLGWVVHRVEHKTLSSAERANEHQHAYELALGAYITALHLPRGDVLVDNFDECITPMLTSVANAKVFVIPNDRDYKEVLDAPLTFHDHYILVAPYTNATAVQNTIDKAYPRLYRSGAGFARLVHQYPALGHVCPAYRLYRVLQDPSDTAIQATIE